LVPFAASRADSATIVIDKKSAFDVAFDLGGFFSDCRFTIDLFWAKVVLSEKCSARHWLIAAAEE
jgi:hypothetical protein